MPKDNWKRVSRQHRCPICGGPDNCSVTVDGGAVLCGRTEAGSIKQNAGGQFLHILRDSNRPHDRFAHHEHPSHRRQREAAPSSARVDFESIARQSFSRADAPLRRQELATSLGVAATALERLLVGPWGLKLSLHWLFPERDGKGHVIGLNRRYQDGRKVAWSGSQRGLLYCDQWQEIEGPVFLVEGPSDTAALLSLGLCAVGRPNNLGGVEYLIELLADLPNKRDVIVLGENDRKLHEALSDNAKQRHKPDCEGCSVCWPGQFGAKQTATKLAEQLYRNIEVMFPPEGSKDVREMVRNLEGVR